MKKIIYFFMLLLIISSATAINFISGTYNEFTETYDNKEFFSANQDIKITYIVNETINQSIFCNSENDFSECGYNETGSLNVSAVYCEHTALSDSESGTLTYANAENLVSIFSTNTGRLYCQVCNNTGSCDNSSQYGELENALYIGKFTIIERLFIGLIGFMIWVAMFYLIFFKDIFKGSVLKAILYYIVFSVVITAIIKAVGLA